MPRTARLRWANSEMHVGTIDEMDALLDTLHDDAVRTEPMLVSVELMPSGDSLSIGLGRDVSVLNYVAGTGDPPYFTSSGGPRGDATVHFFYMGEWSEYLLENAVPVGVARQAIRHFWATGKLDPNVAWEEV